MSSTKTDARFAGVLYLLSGLPGVFSYVYLPAAFVVPRDAAATAFKIANGASTYRFAILSDVAGQIFLVLLVLSLYDILKDVNRRYARLMVALVAVGAAVQIANVFNLITPLILLSGAEFLSVFKAPQLQALALGFLQLRSNALFISQIFWGLWLFPFGMLVIKSGYFPKILGHLLIVASVAYVTASVVFFVLPSHIHPISHVASAVGGLGEIAMIIWLLVKGANVPAAGVVPAGAD